MSNKLPETFEDLCKIAHLRKVQINIGVHPRDVNNELPRITVQACGRDPGDKPYSFSIDILRMNPNTNRQLATGLMDIIQKAKPLKMKLILGKDGE